MEQLSQKAITQTETEHTGLTVLTQPQPSGTQRDCYCDLFYNWQHVWEIYDPSHTQA